MTKFLTRSIDSSRMDELLKLGFSELQAKIIAGRPAPDQYGNSILVDPKLSKLSSPWQLADIDIAVNCVIEAIINNKNIGIQTDHDCDGQTSHAVIFSALHYWFNVPTNNLHSFIGHRLQEGYGLSQSVAERILSNSPKIDVLITADNGSTDEERIAQLMQAGIKVIVTDHHQIPIAGPPKSAVACLNPMRVDCSYPDKNIAGCMVAWLLMSATRAKLIERNILPANTPNLKDLLDYVAVGTVADCVSMARSHNNRIVVHYGLKLISKFKRPCWQAIQPECSPMLTSEDLAFKVAPLLNSDGRLGSAFESVNFLLSQDTDEAKAHQQFLSEQNKERKAIQAELTQQGMQIAKQQVKQGIIGLSIFIQEGHPGVHGISASKIKDAIGRPVVFLTYKSNQQQILTGSIRGISGFNVYHALEWIAKQTDSGIISYGGHQGAGGVSLHKNNLSNFSRYFDAFAKQTLTEQQIGPKIYTDGALPTIGLSQKLVTELLTLAPYGREFEYPVFELSATLMEIHSLGDGKHAKVILHSNGYKYRAVWFFCRESLEQNWPLQAGDKANFAVSLYLSSYQGNNSCSMHILGIN